jgi:hypothetical protein
MSRRFSLVVIGCLVLVSGLALVPASLAQHGSQGTITVTVLDQSGAVVQGAKLELRDSGTNDLRKAETRDGGNYTFVNLSLGTYKLTVSKAGYATQVFDAIVVQAAQTTDLSAVLKVGATSEVVVVSAAESPLVETTSSAIGTTIDMKQIENLPIQGRDLGQLAQLVPGFTGGGQEGGTWNGLPSVAQGNNIDGVIGSSSRMKFGGNAAPAVSPRIEDIQEMTVQTDQLDLNQGYGSSNMQSNFVTRRGSNAFHGRVFEDFRNTVLNANSWNNTVLDLPRNDVKLNDFGGSLGGPIFRDKLFFFGTFAMSKRPGTSNGGVYVLTPDAQQGNFTYLGDDQAQHTVNVLQLAGSNGFPSTVNSQTASTLQAVNNSLQFGSLSPLGDPNLQSLTWQTPASQTIYYPTVRVDFNASEKMRYHVAFNETKTSTPGANTPNLPGPDFANTGAGNQFKSYTAAFGFDWTVTPSIINSFRGGFLYTYSGFAYNGAKLSVDTPQINWNLPSLPFPYSTAMNGTNFQIPTGSYYPLFNASDNLTWQHSRHTFNFGFSWWREQDHYYNGVQGFNVIQLGNSNSGQPGLAPGDPALAAFSGGSGGSLPNGDAAALNEAESLYAILTGRINSIGGQYAFDPATQDYAHQLGAYNLDELQKAWGLFFQDSYRIKPNLTINYGMRWDFTSADRDLTNFYHNSSPADIFGPSGVNNLFNPGSLTGINDPQIAQNSKPYNDWNVSPQPAIGIAWTPNFRSGFLSRVAGGDKTVIRAGFSLRNFTEPQQYVWNQASDYGSFYYQSFFLNANETGANNQVPGAFHPGSLSLGDSLPGFGFAPQAYVKSEPASDFTFIGGPGINGIDPQLKQPYTESWNLGIQRQIGESRALEVRYIGNRTLHQWIATNPNETNVFENGFLDEFKHAQSNLAINNANGFPGSFANNNLPGQVALPIFQAAFAGEDPGGPGSPLLDYSNPTFVSALNTGQVGLIANALEGSGNAPYFCNLVGNQFAPCATNFGFTGPAAGFPVNFFQANPFATGGGGGQGTGYLVAAGYSNYNALQVDFRQRTWHGMQFDANYTWSHTLGISTPNNWQGQVNVFSLRDMKLSYGPTLYDLRHVVHINGTYDLPFGKGKKFLNRGGAVDKIVGGWNIGSIFTFQTGNPFLLQGGYNTFNDNPLVAGTGDSGVVLNGVTPSQLQDSVGVYHIKDSGGAATTQVSFINPKYLASPSGGGANSQFITPNTTPGTVGQLVYLYGPHYINDDLAISKTIAIRENVRFSLQAEMLNAFNHPNFQPGTGTGCVYYCYANGFSPGVNSSSFGIGGISPNYDRSSPNQGMRVIELRANIEF